tara:strand:- start:1405 stop:2340 length:936 start_codon:yes stop_codon:yes gene_type:complete
MKIFTNRIVKPDEIYDDLVVLLDQSIIRYFMERCNAIISGGLAEKIYKKQSLGDYLCSADYNGDIDLYFKNDEDYQKAVEFAKKLNFEEDFSIGIPFGEDERYDKRGILKKQPLIVNAELSCTNISFQGYILLPKKWGPYRAKFQLVGGEFFGKPSEFLLSYDFSNLQRAYFYNAGLLVVCESKRCKELNESKLLELRHSQSPMMMNRIYKYLKHRGYEGITKSSYRHITDWLIKARNGAFKEKIQGIQLYQDALSCGSVEALIKDGTIQTDDLILLIGKIIKTHQYKRGYSYYTVTEDVAMEELKSRSSQ